MPGPRQPVQLLQAKGAKHLTKAEIEERTKTEVKTDTPRYVLPPKWLPEQLRDEFKKISRELIALNIFSKLDADSLAFYLMSRQEWMQDTAELATARRQRDPNSIKLWSDLQAKHFKAARQTANELGLTVTSRCRLVIPKKDEAPPLDDFEALYNRRFG